jgi:hypothetical protein
MTMENAYDAVADILRNDPEAKRGPSDDLSGSAVKVSYNLIEAAGGENATFESVSQARHELQEKLKRSRLAKRQRNR